MYKTVIPRRRYNAWVRIIAILLQNVSAFACPHECLPSGKPGYAKAIKKSCPALYRLGTHVWRIKKLDRAYGT
jgi:hypothetical protein